MEYNTFKQNILTQSSQRRGELSAITKLCVPYILFLFFIIEIRIKEESGFLITHISLRPLRLCVKNYGVIYFMVWTTRSEGYD